MKKNRQGAAKRLEGQVALVTGGSSGIGAGISVEFAREGACVGVVYFSDRDEAEELVERIAGEGGEALAIKADVSRERDVKAMHARLAKAYGRIDILVANAGIQRDSPFVKMSLDHWQEVIATNLSGAFLCARESVRRFLEQGRNPASKARGKILFMSSVHERIPWACRANYAASKGGMSLLMQSLAQEVAPRRIRVNAIAPGAIKTPINEDAWKPAKARRKLLELIPYGRIGEPEDVARAAAWLASDESDYVTGTTLYVDGGMTLYPAFAGNG